MSTKVFKSIKFKLTVVITVVVLIGTVFLSLKFSSTAKNALTESVGVTFSNLTDSVGSEVKKENEKEFLVLGKLSQLEAIMDPNVSYVEKCAILRGVASKDNFYLNITFYDTEGRSVTELGTEITGLGRPFFEEAIKGVSYIMGPVSNPVTGAFSMYYSIPVRSPDGKIIGIVLSVLDGSRICNIVNKINIGKNMHPMVINYKTGALVGDADIDAVRNETNMKDTAQGEFKKIIDDLCTGAKSDGFSFLMYENKGKLGRYLCDYAPIDGCDWSVLAMGEYEDFFQSLSKMRKMGIIFTMAVLLTVIIVAIIAIQKAINPLEQVDNAINEIASGHADLTRRLEINSEDEVGSVSSGFNKFMDKLQTIVKNLKEQGEHLGSAGNNLGSVTEETSSGMTQIISNIENVSSQIIDQSGSVEEVSSAITEINSNIRSLEKMIEMQSNAVSQASSAVEQMIGNISSVNKSVENMADSFSSLMNNTQVGMQKQNDVNEKIKVIESQSEMLQEANEAIANIASQTNLLAMNAAIEAAHAGEAGKGFAVVADEIRKLSETSTAQSKTIGEQLNGIRNSIETAVSSSGEASKAFNSVSERISETDVLVQQIKGAMMEQQVGSTQISDALRDMNDSTSEVKNAAVEMSEGSKAIVGEMENLRTKTSDMKTNTSEMNEGARRINQTASALKDIVGVVNEAMNNIQIEIGQFSV